ncbi:hypothetical protein LMF32_11995 [Desemzia sp. C1]|uniref:hypothetical protein n=1 Tax=Desemzia sp. C1 TaxID=2892016 RepID=UPI001E386F59|nr:hypothetical protein [Desemzia sp. C1]MCI3029766.1 hypothetical protein [Desemzia sp. C1]
MISKQSRKQLINRIEKLDEHAPRKTPFIIFLTDLPDGNVEAAEHIRTSGKKKGLKIRRTIISTEKEFDNYLAKLLTYPKCVVITGDDDLEDC